MIVLYLAILSALVLWAAFYVAVQIYNYFFSWKIAEEYEEIEKKQEKRHLSIVKSDE